MESHRYIYSADGSTRVEVPKIAKRRLAILIAYCGTGYQGLQVNPGAETIEKEIVEACFKAGGILDTNLKKLSRIGWSRAARTDKGVHAAGNLITAKLHVERDDLKLKEFLERINSHLPETIRIIDAMDVTKSFHAQHHCMRRRYEYLLPTYTLATPVHLKRSEKTTEKAHLPAAAVQVTKSNPSTGEEGSAALPREAADTKALQYQPSFSDLVNSEGRNPSDSAEPDVSRSWRIDGLQTGERQRIGRIEGWFRRSLDTTGNNNSGGKSNYGPTMWAKNLVAVEVASNRISDAMLQRVRSILSQYVGTHNFPQFYSKNKGE